MNWYLEVLKKYIDFDGRARRKEYWFFILFTIIVTVFLIVIDVMTGTFDEASGLGLLSGIYTLATFLPALGVAVRRLHDTGKSGWWAVLSFIPLAGLIPLVFFCQDSHDDNEYGENPKF